MQSRQAVCAAASSPLLAARPVSRQQAKAPCCHLGVIGQSRTTRGFLRSSRPQRDLDLLLACSAADRDPECEVVTEPAGTSSSDPDEQPPAALDVSSSSPATLAQHALRSFFSPTKLLAALPLLGLFGGTDAGNISCCPSSLKLLSPKDMVACAISWRHYSSIPTSLITATST